MRRHNGILPYAAMLLSVDKENGGLDFTKPPFSLSQSGRQRFCSHVQYRKKGAGNLRSWLRIIGSASMRLALCWLICYDATFPN